MAQKEADYKKQEGLTFKEVSHLKEEISQALAHMLSDLKGLNSNVVTLEYSVSSYSKLNTLCFLFPLPCNFDIFTRSVGC